MVWYQKNDVIDTKVVLHVITYSTAHGILQEDTVSCLQLETQAQPQLNTQMHSLALLDPQTSITPLPLYCVPLYS